MYGKLKAKLQTMGSPNVYLHWVHTAGLEIYDTIRWCDRI